jgi:hypothetical protein
MNKKILITIGILVIGVVLLLGCMQRQKPTTTTSAVTPSTVPPTTTLPSLEVKVETVCKDGLDNDGDGLVDNMDGDCWIREPIFMEDFDPLLTLKDFQGLLPSLKECGIKTVELMPVVEHCNSKDRGYRWMVRDYFKLDPARGSQDDLESFLDEVHQRDMKAVTMISPEDSGPPELLQKSLLGKQGYDGGGWGDMAICTRRNIQRSKSY